MGGRDRGTGSGDGTAADEAPWFTNIVCLSFWEKMRFHTYRITPYHI